MSSRPPTVAKTSRLYFLARVWAIVVWAIVVWVVAIPSWSVSEAFGQVSSAESTSPKLGGNSDANSKLEADAGFERDIVPIFSAHCVECHNPRELSGGLDLTSEAGFRQGGESGPLIPMKDDTQGLLLERLVQGEMPPPAAGQSRALDSPKIDRIAKWMHAGSPWPVHRVLDAYERTTEVRGGRDWWSFQEIRRPDVVLINMPVGVVHPIDRFVRQRLEAEGFHPAPMADRPTLIRRAYFDLVGLPPSREEVDAFVGDEASDAWSRLLDRLLESPHYGERWARHWLDVVRYAETCGYERDQLKPEIWRYRDWVVQALNSDMPYDQFLTQQLAGDEIADRNEQSVIATGMIRAGTWNDEPNEPADYVYERLEDMVHTSSTAFLAMTVRCARCHDHKFDPIPQVDYYRAASIFWSGYVGQDNLGGPNAQDLGFDCFGWTDKNASPVPIHRLIKGDRSQPAEEVAPGYLSAIPALDQAIPAPLPTGRTSQRRLHWANWMTNQRHPLTARVIVNRLWLHHFGQGLVRTPDNFGFKGELPTHPELLDWLASELKDPAVGLAISSDAKSQAWRLKRIHKLMMTSQTYMQSSSHPDHDSYVQGDATNRWLWRFDRRRLEAESIRDAMLKVSGLWNPSQGGPSFYPSMSSEALEGLSKKEGDWTPSPTEQQNRRSIYMITKRSRLLPMMTSFDSTDTTSPCGQRDCTTVATQALALLNNDFVHQQSRSLADRVQRLAGEDRNARIERLWNLTLSRAPSGTEQAAATRHLEKQVAHYQFQTHTNEPSAKAGGTIVSASAVDAEHLALVSLCHVLLNTNEFLYVD